jgi:hypothetical protein
MQRLILWCLIVQLSACASHGARCNGVLQPINGNDDVQVVHP